MVECGEPSGDESPEGTNEPGAGECVALGVGDCVAFTLFLKSLEPLDRDRERERLFGFVVGSGVETWIVSSEVASTFSSSTSGAGVGSG